MRAVHPLALLAGLAVVLSLGLSSCQSLRDQDLQAISYWNKTWKNLPENRRAARLLLASRRVDELRGLLGKPGSAKALKSFTRLEPRLFLEENTDTDAYPAFLANFGTAPDKAKLVRFLKDANSFLENPASDRPDLVTAYPMLQNGAVAPPKAKTYPANTTLSRYGFDSGRFMAEGDPPFAFRSLPGAAEDYKYKRFRVLKTLSVNECGRSAPWFGQPGGGNQLFLGGQSVRDLLNEGFLVPQTIANRSTPSRLRQIGAILSGDAIPLIAAQADGEKLINEFKFSQIVTVTEDEIYAHVRAHGFPAHTVSAGQAEERYCIREDHGQWRAFYFSHGQRLHEKICATREAAERATLRELLLSAKIEINSAYKASHPGEKLPRPSEIE